MIFFQYKVSRYTLLVLVLYISCDICIQENDFHTSIYFSKQNVCMCVRVCVRACVSTCVCACACVRVCVRALLKVQC